jgi:hypothetical protein
MNIWLRIVQLAYRPETIRLSAFAITLVLGVIWGARHADGIVWGE